MKVKKSKLLTSLKADLKSSEQLKNTQDARIAKWKSEFDGEPYGNEQAGRSRIVSRDIKKQSEWQHATIVDPFVSTSNVISCTPITAEDAASARQNELLLNTQFCRKFDRYNFISKAAKVLDREGTVVIQTGWESEEKEVKVMADVLLVDDENQPILDEFGREQIAQEEVTETITVKNQPTAKVCRNQDIYIDPTCQDDLDNADFIIHRYETNLSSLRKDGRYSNLDKVAMDGARDTDYIPEDVTNFEFKDDPRKKLVVYEYWGNYDVDETGIATPIVCVWVNDVIIRLDKNPYPDKKIPFVVVPFNSVPFTIHGESNAELISDNQKVKTAIIRGTIDNMSQSTNGQVATRKGALDVANRAKFLAGKNFEFNGSKTDFWQGEYNAIPSSAFNMIDLMNNEIEAITATKSFSGGINSGSLGGTATGARGAMDATATRRMDIVRNIAENLVKPLMRKWMAYNSEFLDEEEVIRVTNEEFVPVRRDDLSGNVDIDITISTAEDNAAKSQEISFLLQTLGPSEDPYIRRSLMADILELMRMPDKAKKLREYQPEPDQLEQKMRELQLENLMLENESLKALVKDRNARAGENLVDAEVKKRKAQLDAAKARKINSDADNSDLSFVRQDEGFGHSEAIEMEQLKHDQLMERAQQKHRENLEQMYAQLIAGDTNIGVVR